MNFYKNIIDFKLKNINDTYDFVKSQLEIAKNNCKLQDSLAILVIELLILSLIYF